ncbi:hypothetical protein [Streptomyces sp. NPDC095602]|uniref:hypothetical protein n=1 Tax=Streptomyces sp. NPDC095602 TaxID=3155819 RepID=UPI0033230014
MTLLSTLTDLLATALRDVTALHDPELVRWELGVPLRGGTVVPGSITAFVGTRHPDPERVLRATADRIGGSIGPVSPHFYSSGRLYRTHALQAYWGGIPVSIEAMLPATDAELALQLAGER